MSEGGEGAAGPGEGAFREGGEADRRGLSEVQHHPAPGVEHKAMAIGAAAAAVVAALGRSDEPALLFDSASAQQRMPVGAPRAFRKGGGDREYGGALHALALKKQGKAQVVANGEAYREALPFCQHQLFPRPRVFPSSRRVPSGRSTEKRWSLR